MAIDTKRYTHTYKTKKNIYKKAMARAKREKGSLANLIENVVILYAQDFDLTPTIKDPFGYEIEPIKPIKQ